ncbi:MAG: hypothetical protein AAF950_00810 [Pseudomonadota bacterium]
MSQLDMTVPGRKVASVAAFLSLPFAYLTQTLYVTAAGGDVGIFFEGAKILAVSQQQAGYFYTAMWTDVLGYYLILIPVIVYAWKALRGVNETLADIAFFCGTIFCLLGSFGAVTMAGAFNILYASFSDATLEQQAAAIAAWEATIYGQWRGLWLLEATLAFVFLVGLGRLLLDIGRTGLGGVAILLGLIWIVQFTTWQLGYHAVSDAALTAVVLLAPLWSAWLGVVLWRLRA